MKNITHEAVNKQFEEWKSWYEENNRRGRDDVGFYLGDQWEVPQITNRGNSNKETLVFNLAAKQIKRASAQLMETEFSLNVSPLNEEAAENVQETCAFRKILETIMLSEDNIKKLLMCGDKTIKFGYSFIEVNFERENKQSLSSIPVLRLHTDPSVAFWDKNAKHPTRVDGRFCGIKKKCSGEEIYEQFEKKVTKSKLDSMVHKDENDIYYYWFRDYKDYEYKLLNTGQYKQADLLDNDDILATEEDARLIFDTLCADEKMAQGNKPSPLIKYDCVSCIYFQVFLNEKVLIKPKLFPTDDLPLVYHYGLTEWDGHQGMKTIPLAHFLKDPQKMHNYINSQIATMAKNSSAVKWIFQQDHLLTPTQENEAKEFNTLEGGFIFGGDTSTIRRENPPELPVSLIQMGQIAKQEIDEIGGAMIDAQSSDTTIISGVAMDKITHNMGLINLFFLGHHISFVNSVGRLMRQMIPRIITEERTVIAKSQDGTGEAIIVNRDVGTGKIQNNIKDINNNYDYEFTAGPNSPMQKENSRKAIQEYIAINPQAAMFIGDIYMRNLDSKDAGELERRVSAMMDQNLIKFGKGEISLQEYQQLSAQAAQQQMQQKIQHAQVLSKLDPQYQSAHELAMSDNKKADAMQFDAQTKRIIGLEQEKTKRIQAAQKAHEGMQKILLQLEELRQKAGIEAGNQQLEMIEKELKATQQIIDASEISDAAETARNSDQ
jgi:hypothetical protein